MSDWYYAANNEQKGPINESELKANFAANKLPVDTLVWKDGMDNWTAANQIPAFSFRQPPTPANSLFPACRPARLLPGCVGCAGLLSHRRRPDTPRRSYLDQGRTTPLLRAYAIDCPRCSC